MRKENWGFSRFERGPTNCFKTMFCSDLLLFYEPSQLPLAFFVGANDFLRNNNASQAAIARRIRSRAFSARIVVI